MTRLAAVAVVAFAAFAGNAGAATFAVVPNSLPSAQTPNTPGSLVLPPAWTERATRPQSMSAEQLQQLWRRAGAGYGIPWEVLAAINEIETNFGGNMGPSSAGAVGWMQFMPDTWLRWGMDGSGDGVADPWNAEDGVFSAARYLAAAGGASDLRRGIFAYNHADWYVEDVLRLAALHAGGRPVAPAGGLATSDEMPPTLAPGEVGFTLGGVDVTLEEASREVAAASERLRRAVASEQALARASARLLRRSQRPALLTKRLALQQQAAQADMWRQTALDRASSLRDELAARKADLLRAKEAGANAPVTTALSGNLLTAAAGSSLSGGYVFPVGGGPATVSVSQTHHDYPAADIAAPTGAPVYAHASGMVASAWHSSDGRCGIGLTLRTDDGLTWTYCHFSYLDPSVTAGTAIAAGTPIALVGSTGNSSGPHLHLQLQPTTVYPQDYAWFRSFAGTAFRWQDGEPSRPMIETAAGSATATFAAPETPAPGDGAVVVTFTR